MHVNRTTLALSLVLLTVRAEASHAIKVHMHDAGGYAADGMLYQPTGQPPFAGLVLIPDDRGITNRVDEAAQHFADAGYVAVAIDVNRGVSANEAPRSGEQVRHDIEAAFAFLSLQETVTQNAVGAVAWGSASEYALGLAAESKVRAVAIEDLILSKDAARTARIRVPLLASAAGKSGAAGAQSAEALRRALAHSGLPVDIKVYAQSERGFEDSTDPAHFRQADAEDVQRRELQFFNRNLQPRP